MESENYDVQPWSKSNPSEAAQPIQMNRRQRRGADARAKKAARRLKLNAPKGEGFKELHLAIIVDGHRHFSHALTKAQAESALVAVSHLGKYLIEAYSLGEKPPE